MKVHKFIVMVVDHEDLGAYVIENMIENANDWIIPHIMATESKDIGKWEDSNPLNFEKTQQAEFKRLFE